MTSPDNQYTRMQQAFYDACAPAWSPDNRDPVVGSFDAHEAWRDYDDLLFAGTPRGGAALDFGCGPGRGIVHFWDRFRRIDGADICQANLDNARRWFDLSKREGRIKGDGTEPRLYKVDGVSLEGVPNDIYNVVYSTICLQHICVHEIRMGLFREFRRVLRGGGYLCVQMGFGPGHPRSVGYFDDAWDARGTNSQLDTRVEQPGELAGDLLIAGFESFRHAIRPVGPGDLHGNWIFFQAT